VVEEGEALFVGDARKSIIRILAFEVRKQFGELVVFPELGNAIAQRLPPDNGAEVAVLVAAVNVGLDSALEVRRPAFVEPEVFLRMSKLACVEFKEMSERTQLALETRLPDQECDSSCAMTSTFCLSPLTIVGVAKVYTGFSIL